MQQKEAKGDFNNEVHDEYETPLALCQRELWWLIKGEIEHLLLTEERLKRTEVRDGK